MIGRTLGLYFAKLFLKNMLLIFLLIMFLIVAVDMTDQARRMSRYPDVPFWQFLMISLARAPGFAERILPFAILFGCMATLLTLNKRMELVVARAAGVSVWQFIWPAAISAIIIGLFSMTVYNPLALKSAAYGRTIEATIYGQKGNTEAGRTRNLWVRQYSGDGDMIIRAVVSQKGGLLLNGVMAYRFDSNGFLKERIDAGGAVYRPASADASAYWSLRNATITRVGERAKTVKSYDIETNLSPGQLDRASTRAEDVSFWDLPARIEQANNADRLSNNFKMQLQGLFARPLFFVAMVLIAASVSLQFIRFGQNSKVILTGILAGFVLYVVTELVVGFGKNGVVPPWLAAWTPATMVALISVTILLHQEDG